MSTIRQSSIFIASILVSTACGARTSLIDGETASAQGGGLGTGASTALSTTGTGSSSNGCTDEVLANDPNGAAILEVDGDEVFWGTVDGEVWKRKGSQTTKLSTAQNTVSALAIDANNVYYGDGVTIDSVPRAGGEVTTVAELTFEPVILKVDGLAIFALDRGGGFDSGGVFRIPHQGMPLEILTGLDFPSGMALDTDNVYVVAPHAVVDGQDQMGALVSVPKTGGDAHVLASELSEPQGLALYGGNAYFLEQAESVSSPSAGLRSVPIAGGDVTQIAQTPDVLPLDVAVDASGAYVTLFTSNQAAILHVALDGSSPTSLTSTPGVLYGAVRTSDTAVCWAINWVATMHPADDSSLRKKCK